MTILDDVKLITCILPAGQGEVLVSALNDELALTSATVVKGRGGSARGGSFSEEMDVLSVTVESQRADEVFEFLYFRSDIDHLAHRFMFQVALARGTGFELPELPGEGERP